MQSSDAASTAALFLPIADLLQRTEQKLQKLTDFSAAIGQPLEVLSIRPGKRLRPALLLLSASMFSAPSEDCITAAAALEAVHLASLFHDDVIDETSMRRGSGTLNFQLGNKYSILIGDYILAQATQSLADISNSSIISIVTQAAREMSRGQLLELRYKGDASVSIDCYLDIIGAKTASLLSACCSIGALLSGADAKAQKSLAVYGFNLGLAFQITDDLLDIWGDPQVLGKPVLSDIKESKYTVPLLLARDKSGRNELTALLKQTQQSFSQSLESEILEYLDRNGAKEQTAALARHYADLARQALQEINAQNAVQTLAGIAAWVVDRQN
ncbi:MAG: polyprenyl synthetase family protein [bacterium]|nr:polyprenyl synthetase family protein [bacterium]